jgi:hypothetical protein
MTHVAVRIAGGKNLNDFPVALIQASVGQLKAIACLAKSRFAKGLIR